MRINAVKMRKFCRPFRIVLGLGLIGGAIASGIVWLYLGVIPLVAGVANFCPLCKITGQCDIFGKDVQ